MLKLLVAICISASIILCEINRFLFELKYSKVFKCINYFRHDDQLRRQSMWHYCDVKIFTNSHRQNGNRKMPFLFSRIMTLKWPSIITPLWSHSNRFLSNLQFAIKWDIRRHGYDSFPAKEEEVKKRRRKYE